MESRIWQHQPSGERFAVALDSYGLILAAAGPLHHSEIAVALAGDWDGDDDVTIAIRLEREHYQDVTDAARAEIEQERRDRRLSAIGHYPREHRLPGDPPDIII